MSRDICEILGNIHRSDLTQNMKRTCIEINGNLHFSPIWDGEKQTFTFVKGIHVYGPNISVD